LIEKVEFLPMTTDGYPETPRTLDADTGEDVNKDDTLPNGERMPEPVPPAGIPVSQEMRDYVRGLRERIARDPRAVPGQLHIWLAEYTKAHTDANRPLSRRMAMMEEFGEAPDPRAAAEAEKAKGERLDKVIEALAVKQNAETNREDVLVKHLTGAMRLGGDISVRTIEAQTKTIESLGGTVSALTGIVSTFGGVAKEQYEATISAINAYKQYSNGQPMPVGWNVERLIATAGQVLEAIAPALAKMRLLERAQGLGVPMGMVDAMADQKAKELAAARPAPAPAQAPVQHAESQRKASRQAQRSAARQAQLGRHFTKEDKLTIIDARLVQDDKK
jgi:hypothetical protein